MINAIPANIKANNHDIGDFPVFSDGHPVIFKVVADICQEGIPDRCSDDSVNAEFNNTHPANPGGDRNEMSNNRNEAAHEYCLVAVPGEKSSQSYRGDARSSNRYLPKRLNEWPSAPGAGIVRN